MSSSDPCKHLFVSLRILSCFREGSTLVRGDVHALRTQVLKQRDDKMLPNRFHWGNFYIRFIFSSPLEALTMAQRLIDDFKTIISSPFSGCQPHTHAHPSVSTHRALRLIDPQPAESQRSHDVRRIWPRSRRRASRFTSDASHIQSGAGGGSAERGGEGSVSSLRIALT